ncbi:MAG TPA: ABC transporter permease [Acidimicrobiia bacterium]|nr:ABC transporter permease [Acidimicrobiia bacterium]
MTVQGPLGSSETAEITIAARNRSVARGAARQVLPPVILGLVLLGVWYFVSYVVLDDARRFLLKPPHEVVAVGFLDGANLAEMTSGLWSSTKVAMIGLGISIVLGVGLAVAMSQSKLIERAIFPYAVTLQAIPILAIVPLLGFWFGYRLTPRVVICVIISIFPIIVNTLFGLLSAERAMHDLFTLHRASRLTRLRKLMFPASLPAMFTGLRIAAGLSVIGAIVGDFFFGRGEIGIGQLLLRYANRLQGEQLLASIIVSSALGVAVFLLFGWLQERVTGKWDDRGAR